MPVSPVAFADDRAGQHVQRGEQRGRPVALVVMDHRAVTARLHRQARLRTVQGLNLALLVHAQHDAQHDCLVRRVQVQPHDVGQLLDERPVGRQLERRDAVRLQPVRVPDTLNIRLVMGSGSSGVARRDPNYTATRADPTKPQREAPLVEIVSIERGSSATLKSLRHRVAGIHAATWRIAAGADCSARPALRHISRSPRSDHRLRTRQHPGWPSRTSVTTTIRHSRLECMKSAKASPLRGRDSPVTSAAHWPSTRTAPAHAHRASGQARRAAVQEEGRYALGQGRGRRGRDPRG